MKGNQDWFVVMIDGIRALILEYLPPHPTPLLIFSLLEQFLMYIDSVGPDGPMDMETDGPLLDDVGALKKAVEEEATQIRKTDVSITESITVVTITVVSHPALISKQTEFFSVTCDLTIRQCQFYLYSTSHYK